MFNTSSQDIKSVDFSPNISWLFSRIAIVWPPPLQHNLKYDAKNMFSSAQATQMPVWVALCVRFLFNIAVFNRFSRCLDHRFRSFRSLFESISIDYKTLEHWELRFCIWNFLSAAFFANSWVALKGAFDFSLQTSRMVHVWTYLFSQTLALPRRWLE